MAARDRLIELGALPRLRVEVGVEQHRPRANRKPNGICPLRAGTPYETGYGEDQPEHDEHDSLQR